MVQDLLPRWRAELAEVGYPPVELAAAVERAGRAYVPPGPDLVDGLVDELLGPGGRLAAEKTFDLRDAVVAVAPLVHGLPVSMLGTAVQRVLSDERAVALPLVAGARGRCGRPPACAGDAPLRRISDGFQVGRRLHRSPHT
jgi:hypothetical protein